MKKKVKKASFGLVSIAILGMSCNAFGADGVPASAATMPVPAAATREDHVRDIARQELSNRRPSLMKEAIVANDEIVHAIFFLEKKDTGQAYKMLTKADGQLNILLTRDPNLKLAPIDVRANVMDLEVSPGKIRNAVRDAKSELDNGHIQAARILLAPLVSEMHIETDFLPLGIYPNAIKQASKEIQASRLDEAESTLADALSSIVTSKEVIPLPPLKAEGDVLRAEQLLNKDKVDNRNKVLSLLDSADNHLADSEALGYGKYQTIRNEIASIKTRVEGGEAKPDLFERVKGLFHEIMHGKKG